MNRHQATTALALTVAAVALSTGGAVAGAKITGAQIKDGTVTSKDVKNGTLVAADLSRSTVQGFSKPGPQGLRGAPGTPGTPGTARAWGRVRADGTVFQSSGDITVSRPAQGLYCIAVAGVAPGSTVAVVSADYEFGGTNTGSNLPQEIVEYAGHGGACPSSSLAVRTLVRQFVPTSGPITSTTVTFEDQPFTFVVP